MFNVQTSLMEERFSKSSRHFSIKKQSAFKFPLKSSTASHGNQLKPMHLNDLPNRPIAVFGNLYNSNSG